MTLINTHNIMDMEYKNYMDMQYKKHKEYKRIVKNAEKAVLFIHGIVGTPNHFDFFIKSLPENISAHSILLDGHGKGVKDFSKTSMQKWENQVTMVVNELSEAHEDVYIVGHSLGSLLAIEQALNNAEVSKLLLLAVPLKLFFKPKMLVNSIKVFFNRIDPTDKELLAAKNCYGIEEDKNPLHYIGWIPRFLELFSKIRKTRKIIGSVKTSCIAYQSAKDELVSGKSNGLLEKNPIILVKELKNSGHYYYEEGDVLILKQDFMDFLS